MADAPDTNTPAESTPSLPQPGQTLAPGAAAAPSSTTPQHLNSQTPPLGHGKNKQPLLMIIALVILVAAAAVVADKLLVKNNTTKTATKTTATTTKRDIPVLNYGLAGGDVVPQYPTNYPYANNGIFIASQLFEGLVGYQNQTKIVPLLATNWSNTNDTTWIFNLRQGVKFHSGRTMTAADVKFSLDYAVAHQKDSNSALFVANTIKSVDATSTYTVTITTAKPDPVLLNRLSILGIADSKATLGDFTAGTGPYTVKMGTTPSATAIDLAAFDGYWGGHAYTREVKFKLYTDASQLAIDTAKGSFGIAGIFNSKQLSSIPHTKVISLPDQGLTYIGVNTVRSGSPLTSVAARQAVAYALDIPSILKAGGLAAEQDSQIVPLQLPGHNPAISNTPFNLTKAKQLLGGVTNASAAITFAYPTSDAAQATEMIKELKAAGFNITGVSVDDFTVFTNDTLSGKYDLFTAGDTSATVDGLDILTDLLIGNSDYDSTQIDTLVKQAGSTLNPATRISEMQQIATIVYKDKPIIPLYTLTRSYAVTKPYVINTDLPDLATSTYLWKVYQY